MIKSITYPNGTMAVLGLDISQVKTSPEDAKASRKELQSQLDESAKKIAINIIPRLQTGISFSMQDLLTELDDPSKALASTLYFTGERICKTYESVMLAANMTIQAYMNIIEDKAIADEVKGLSKVNDSDDRIKQAQEMLETIRKQKTSRSAS